ncbi:MAG: carbohydrate porin [Deltaproteobacteria bacterium]|nr:carbohydrate porin [Deltaproteobacteria bacterium]
MGILGLFMSSVLVIASQSGGAVTQSDKDSEKSEKSEAAITAGTSESDNSDKKTVGDSVKKSAEEKHQSDLKDAKMYTELRNRISRLEELLNKNKKSELKTVVTEKPVKASEKFNGFRFGSYGRVNFGRNMDGEPIYPVNITAHAPRLEESSYVELDLYYYHRFEGDILTKTVTTLALADSLFHYNGTWDSSIAVRNLYLEVKKSGLEGLSFWAGSRMYRGDDIYLLDFWPLDNLNTLGAGIWWDKKPLRGGIHVGINRVLGKFQYQESSVETPYVGSESIPTLNRQRTIASAKLEYWNQNKGSMGFKVKGYAEFHSLAAGTYNALEDQPEQIALPSETGFVAGIQFGIWDFMPKSFVNVFARYSTGIASYGEFSTPFGLGFEQDLDSSYSAKNAKEFVIAATGNIKFGSHVSLMFGGYFRNFIDADSLDYDWDDGYEIVFAARPIYWMPGEWGRNLALSGEVSYQMTERNGLNPDTGVSAHPSVWKFSIIPTWFSSRTSYSRPAIRLVYTVAMPDDDARLWYHEKDYRRSRSVEHFIGIQAEWWFNSSTYN